MPATTQLDLDGVLLIDLNVFPDARGWFQEFWNPEENPIPGVPREFKQDNLAFSNQRVLRGLHFQDPFGQGKLITVVHGEIFDAVVDVRRSSPSFGRFVTATLVAGSGQALYVPAGYAHGYQVLSSTAAIVYKCTETFHPQAEHTLLWNDPDVGIHWPLDQPILSPKDQAGTPLRHLSQPE